MKFKDESDAAVYEVDCNEFKKLSSMPEDVAIKSNDKVVVFVERAEEMGLVSDVLEDVLIRSDQYDMVLFTKNSP